MKTGPNDYAFPYNDPYLEDGLNKREYFAAMALQGIMATHAAPWSAAQIAVRAADALIAELNKETNKQGDNQK